VGVSELLALQEKEIEETVPDSPGPTFEIGVCIPIKTSQLVGDSEIQDLTDADQISNSLEETQDNENQKAGETCDEEKSNSLDTINITDEAPATDEILRQKKKKKKKDKHAGKIIQEILNNRIFNRRISRKVLSRQTLRMHPVPNW